MNKLLLVWRQWSTYQLKMYTFLKVCLCAHYSISQVELVFDLCIYISIHKLLSLLALKTEEMIFKHTEKIESNVFVKDFIVTKPYWKTGGEQGYFYSKPFGDLKNIRFLCCLISQVSYNFGSHMCSALTSIK